MNEIVVVANGLDFLVDQLAITISKTNQIAGTLGRAVDQTRLVTEQLTADAVNQQRSIKASFHLLSDSFRAQEQITEHTTRLQEMARSNSTALSGINNMFEGVVQTVASLNDNMTTLYSSIQEFSHSSRGIAGLAEEAATTVNDVSVAMVDINASVQEINTVVQESSELSETATASISSKGINAVSNAIDTMNHIESYFNSLSGTIIRLDSRSQDIAKILHTIHEVTAQVNLLSLNAMIIAGQAGGSGSSFTVVAKEMKRLATKTGESAKEIEQIVEAIQNEIAAAVSDTQETARAVNEGKTVAVITGEVIDEILELSCRTNSMIQGIANSTDKQNRMITSVNRDIERLQELNQKVKTATGEEELSTGYINECCKQYFCVIE